MAALSSFLSLLARHANGLSDPTWDHTNNTSPAPRVDDLRKQISLIEASRSSSSGSDDHASPSSSFQTSPVDEEIELLSQVGSILINALKLAVQSSTHREYQCHCSNEDHAIQIADLESEVESLSHSRMEMRRRIDEHKRESLRLGRALLQAEIALAEQEQQHASRMKRSRAGTFNTNEYGMGHSNGSGSDDEWFSDGDSEDDEDWARDLGRTSVRRRSIMYRQTPVPMQSLQTPNRGMMSPRTVRARAGSSPEFFQEESNNNDDTPSENQQVLGNLNQLHPSTPVFTKSFSASRAARAGSVEGKSDVTAAAAAAGGCATCQPKVQRLHGELQTARKTRDDVLTDLRALQERAEEHDNDWDSLERHLAQMTLERDELKQLTQSMREAATEAAHEAAASDTPPRLRDLLVNSAHAFSGIAAVEVESAKFECDDHVLIGEADTDGGGDENSNEAETCGADEVQVDETEDSCNHVASHHSKSEDTTTIISSNTTTSFTTINISNNHTTTNGNNINNNKNNIIKSDLAIPARSQDQKVHNGIMGSVRNVHRRRKSWPDCETRTQQNFEIGYDAAIRVAHTNVGVGHLESNISNGSGGIHYCSNNSEKDTNTSTTQLLLDASTTQCQKDSQQETTINSNGNGGGGGGGGANDTETNVLSRQMSVDTNTQGQVEVQEKTTTTATDTKTNVRSLISRYESKATPPVAAAVEKMTATNMSKKLLVKTNPNNSSGVARGFRSFMASPIRTVFGTNARSPSSSSSSSSHSSNAPDMPSTAQREFRTSSLRAISLDDSVKSISSTSATQRTTAVATTAVDVEYNTNAIVEKSGSIFSSCQTETLQTKATEAQTTDFAPEEESNLLNNINDDGGVPSSTASASSLTNTVVGNDTMNHSNNHHHHRSIGASEMEDKGTQCMLIYKTIVQSLHSELESVGGEAAAAGVPWLTHSEITNTMTTTSSSIDENESQDAMHNNNTATANNNNNDVLMRVKQIRIAARGQLLIKSLRVGRRRTWRPRYCVLKGPSLLVFRNELDNRPSLTIPLDGTEVRVLHCSVHDVNHTTDHRNKAVAHEFHLWHPSRPVLLCSATSEADMVQWLEAIQQQHSSVAVRPRRFAAGFLRIGRQRYFSVLRANGLHFYSRVSAHTAKDVLLVDGQSQVEQESENAGGGSHRMSEDGEEVEHAFRISHNSSQHQGAMRESLVVMADSARDCAWWMDTIQAHILGVVSWGAMHGLRDGPFGCQNF